ncbi:MAG TPA: diacylglyceryl transferase [Chitinophagaceae bacterium]|nr:diacylglyceryl transferase [Chitinophagaceae bacterium]
MYPNLYYAFKDLFGLEWPVLRFVNSFGFFVAIAFLIAAYVLSRELKRKSGQGLFTPTETTITIGEPASWVDLGSNFGLGYLLGFKVVALFFLDEATMQNPQAYIFSAQGSPPAGLFVGLFFAAVKWWEKNKEKLAKPEKRLIRIWPQDRVGEITLLALVYGLAGAKLFDIFENWSSFLQNPAAYIFSPAGLTMYGGLICAAIAIGVYARKHKIGFFALADAVAPALMLAYGIGRIGCHVAGDGDWGIMSDLASKPTFLPDWAWSYQYPHNVLEEGVPIAGCVGPFCNQLPAGAFPTPLYEAVACIVLFGVLWGVRKRIKITGQMFSLYLILNGLERFAIEKIRVNIKMDLLGFHPTQAELIATFLMVLGLALFIWKGRRVAAVAK